MLDRRSLLLGASATGVLGLSACTNETSGELSPGEARLLSIVNIVDVNVSSNGDRIFGGIAGRQQIPFMDEQIIADVERAVRSELVGLGSGQKTALNIGITWIQLGPFDLNMGARLSSSALGPRGAREELVSIFGGFVMRTPKGSRSLPTDQKYKAVVQGFAEQLRAKLETETVRI